MFAYIRRYSEFLVITMCLTALTLIIGGTVIVSSNVNMVQDNWTKYQRGALEAIADIEMLENALGYGGMIHNFKNIVLRKDKQLNQPLERNFSQAMASLNNLKENPIFRNHGTQITEIEAVIEKYKHNYETLKQLIEQPLTAEEIDQQVKVNDANALRELRKLRQHIDETFSTHMANSDYFLSKTVFFSNLSYITIPIVLILSFLAILFTFHARKEERRFRMLFENSPDAYLETDTQGKILMVNQKLIDLFGYRKSEIIGRSVDTLVPKEMREAHKKHRAAFVKNSSNRRMGDGSKPLYGVKKDGDSFPVEISLSAYQKTTSVKHVVAAIRDITEQLKHRRNATTDRLTNLRNRPFMEEHAMHRIKESARHNHMLSLLIIDIDFFKRVNDKYGHDVGDQVLIEFSIALKSVCRETDTVGRWGGEEFLVICSHTSENEADVLADRICKTISQRQFRQVGQITCSVGVAALKQGTGFVTLFHDADQALYEAKNRGRNQVVKFSRTG